MTNPRPGARLSRSAAITGLAALTAFTVPACGSSTPETPSTSELFQEYIDSTDVENDPFGSGGTPEDRKANFAAHGTAQQLFSTLLSASPCGTDPDAGCPRAGKPDYQRYILVKHQDGSLEVMPLYVARRSDGPDVLMDSNGESYTGGLDDFRRNNDLLGADDMVLTARDVTSTAGGKAVVVTGHTDEDTWRPWLIGGAVMAALTAGALAIRFDIRRRSRGVI